MQSRNVTFVGNCQALALAKLYREFVGAPDRENVVYFDDLGLTPPEVRGGVADADVLVVQERDFNHGLTADELRPGVVVHPFPMVLAGFLWPYANEQHVHNQPEPPFSDGPYPQQLGDSFLNRMIRQGVSPEQALADYLAHDIARAAHLERMAELYLDRQRDRDVRTGFALAPMIEATFRTEQLFLTPNHPTARLFGVIASQLFERMGVSAERLQLALASLQHSPFPPDELPLHPGVIAHFGLAFADADKLYSYFDEGRFSFPEFVLRYMRFEHNHDLRLGIARFLTEGTTEVLPALERGLARSPDSVRGWRVMAMILDRMGRTDEAQAAYHRSIAAAPGDPEGHIALAHSAIRRGAADEALESAGMATAIAPASGQAWSVLADVRRRTGDVAGAIAAAREAVRLLPASAAAYQMLAVSLVQAGDFAEAETAARAALGWEPDSADTGNVLAEVFEAAGRRPAAIETMRSAIARGATNGQTYSLLGNFLFRDGDHRGAREAFLSCLALEPDRSDIAGMLAFIREQLGEAAA